MSANLRAANLQYANLKLANLRDASFENANLVDIMNIGQGLNLADANFNNIIVTTKETKSIKKFLTQKTMFTIKEVESPVNSGCLK